LNQGQSNVDMRIANLTSYIKSLQVN
jgi:hypothetical protein